MSCSYQIRGLNIKTSTGVWSYQQLGEFNDPATLDGYEGQLMTAWKVDKIGSKNNDCVESR